MPRAQPIAARECQRVCKPGSVHPPKRDRRPFLSGDTCVAPPATNPGSGPEHAPKRSRASCRPYSVLLPVGFAMPLPLPAARCALTAPFHRNPAEAKGRLLSVALSLNPLTEVAKPAGRYPAPSFPWSPDFPRHARRVTRPPDPLTLASLAACDPAFNRRLAASAATARGAAFDIRHRQCRRSSQGETAAGTR